MCGVISNTEVCFRCHNKIVEFTEYRRESFEVPINYFNFKQFTQGCFELKYKDWEITKDSNKITYTLVQELYGSLMEDYELPFVEYQKQILS